MNAKGKNGSRNRRLGDDRREEAPLKRTTKQSVTETLGGVAMKTNEMLNRDDDFLPVAEKKRVSAFFTSLFCVSFTLAHLASVSCRRAPLLTRVRLIWICYILIKEVSIVFAVPPLRKTK